MNGFEFYRLKQNLSQKQVAEKAGCKIETVRRLESARMFGTDVRLGVRVADALGVSLNEATRDFSDGILYIKRVFVANECTNDNRLERYRIDNKITYSALGKILGITRQAAQHACKIATAPKKHIFILAKHEGMTIDEFNSVFFDSKTA